MSTTSFENFADYYDEVMGDSGDYTHQKTIDPALLACAGNVKGKVIYDVGCGNGYIARKLHKMGAKEVWASDISPNIINIAKTKYPNHKVKYLAQEGSDFTKIPRDYFDLITMNMSIHYIRNLNSLFKGVSRALKVGGLFVFTRDHPLKLLSHLDVNRIDKIEVVLASAKKYTDSRTEVVYNHWTKKKDLVIYHRPLGTYIEIMSKHGLLTETILEPKTNALKSYETGEIVATNIPSIVAIRAVKTV